MKSCNSCMDMISNIWSFGITALELAHGHAPFSKYSLMKVLLMTLQNAPPGLDYERDKQFSKVYLILGKINAEYFILLLKHKRFAVFKRNGCCLLGKGSQKTS
ncbi:hypothetical protein ACS0TY_006387 [Phlomoides rotata]